MDLLQKERKLSEDIHSIEKRIESSHDFNEIMTLRRELSILKMKKEAITNRLKGEWSLQKNASNGLTLNIKS